MTGQSKHFYIFGPFRLDPEERLLFRSGELLPLPLKTFEILSLLVRNSGRILDKAELMRNIWDDSFVEETNLTVQIAKLRKVLGRDDNGDSYIETLPKRGYRLTAPVREVNFSGHPEPPARVSEEIKSLAVLPLADFSGDRAQGYFADGMTEALINNLAQVAALRVISRTSVMQYKGGRKPLPEIARQLHVEGVVEGSVQRSGDRVRITVQLIHAPTDQHLWAQSYDRDLRDVLTLQSEVAQAIAGEIRIKLTPREQTRLAAARSIDREAYDAYLKGRYFFWNKWTQEGLTKSVEYFQQAIAKDPGCAQAHTGLAECYNRLGAYNFLSPNDTYPHAKAAAMRALELDEKLAEAHSSLAVVRMLYEWDLTGAEREFQRAIELNPGYALAHCLYGRCLVRRGRPGAALAQVKQAQELDPLSLVINTDLAEAFWRAGQYDEAIAQARKVLEMDPNFWRAYEILGKTLEQKAMYEEAIVAFQKAVDVSGEPRSIANLGCAYAAAGKKKQAQKLIEKLQELSKRRYVLAMDIARIYAALGEKESAFEWLDKAYERRDNLILMKTETYFQKLHGDPRFTALLRCAGLSLFGNKDEALQ